MGAFSVPFPLGLPGMRAPSVPSAGSEEPEESESSDSNLELGHCLLRYWLRRCARFLAWRDRMEAVIFSTSALLAEFPLLPVVVSLNMRRGFWRYPLTRWIRGSGGKIG